MIWQREAIQPHWKFRKVVQSPHLAQFLYVLNRILCYLTFPLTVFFSIAIYYICLYLKQTTSFLSLLDICVEF